MSPEDICEEILNTWWDWSVQPAARPRVLGRLDNGSVNHCWLVSDGEQKLVVRASSGQLGIGPEVQHSVPEYRAMVIAWGGERATAEQLRTQTGLEQLALSLRLLHGAEPRLQTPGYRNTLNTYRALLPTDIEWDENGKMQDYARQLDEDADHQVLCHHDVSLGNILFDTDRVRLIDWEYARVGHALFDLASIVHSLELDMLASQTLLDAYQAPPHFREELPRILEFIDYLNQLWAVAIRTRQPLGC